jgi:hypothetical protein
LKTRAVKSQETEKTTSKPAGKEKGTTKKEQPKSSSAPGKTRSLCLYDEIDEDFEAAKAPTQLEVLQTMRKN